MKKDEIVDALLAKGCKIEEISGLKIKELRIMLDEENKGEDSLILLDRVKETEEDIGVVKTPNKTTEVKLEVSSSDKEINNTALALSDPPCPTDSGWVQYVLSLFLDDELDNSNPRMEALRRVSELLIGEIVEERSELISAPTQENGDRACSKASIVFNNGQIFEGLADACPSNCQKEYAMFPVAMSETRAKGRAYRAALRLRRVVAAEEVGVSSDEEIENPNKLINTGQITTIRLLCERLGISIQKLLLDLEITCETKDNVANLSKLRYGEGLIVLNRLNNIRQEGVVQAKLQR